MNDLRPQFYLDPEVLFLNHGSFGASPRPVIESYQDWQRRLERQPVKFLIREFQEYLRTARQDLGRALGADPDHLVYVPNATFGVNVIARSMEFQPGDELLTSNQEYGACKNIWAFLSDEYGLHIIQQEVPLPLPNRDEIVDIIWSGVSERTRLIFLSQITFDHRQQSAFL